jgi:hypothetical protein
MSKSVQAMMEKKEIKPEEDRMVTGIVKNLQYPGQPIEFCFRSHGKKIHTYKFKDNEMCTMPMSVAKHINNVKYQKHSFLLDQHGNHVKDPSPVNRFSFTSMEYM